MSSKTAGADARGPQFALRAWAPSMLWQGPFVNLGYALGALRGNPLKATAGLCASAPMRKKWIVSMKEKKTMKKIHDQTAASKKARSNLFFFCTKKETFLPFIVSLFFFWIFCRRRKRGKGLRLRVHRRHGGQLNTGGFNFHDATAVVGDARSNDSDWRRIARRVGRGRRRDEIRGHCHQGRRMLPRR